MRFIKHNGMSYLVLDASAEHVFVKAVEDQRCKGPLQVVILCRVNSDDNRLMTLPQALAGIRQIEEYIVSESVQARQQRTKRSVWFRVGTKNLHETAEIRFLQLGQNRTRVIPSLLNKAILDGLTDPLALDVSEFRENRDENIPQHARDIEISCAGFAVHYLQRVKPQSTEVNESNRVNQVLKSLVNVLMIREHDRSNAGVQHLFT